jgi:hypothetical protein
MQNLHTQSYDVKQKQKPEFMIWESLNGFLSNEF